MTKLIETFNYAIQIRFYINNEGYGKRIEFTPESVNSKEHLKQLVGAYLDTWKDGVFKIIDQKY